MNLSRLSAREIETQARALELQLKKLDTPLPPDTVGASAQRRAQEDAPRRSKDPTRATRQRVRGTYLRRCSRRLAFAWRSAELRRALRV